MMEVSVGEENKGEYFMLKDIIIKIENEVLARCGSK